MRVDLETWKRKWRCLGYTIRNSDTVVAEKKALEWIPQGHGREADLEKNRRRGGSSSEDLVQLRVLAIGAEMNRELFLIPNVPA